VGSISVLWRHRLLPRKSGPDHNNRAKSTIVNNNPNIPASTIIPATPLAAVPATPLAIIQTPKTKTDEHDKRDPKKGDC
jgi:hypothetical protein